MSDPEGTPTPKEELTISQKLDRIIELLEQLVGATDGAAEQAELATHSMHCKCGRC